MASDERPTVRTDLRAAHLLILGESIERAIHEVQAIHDRCRDLLLPTGWFDITDLEELQQRITAELLNSPAPQMHRIALTLEDFQALVRGREVQRTGVRVILQDIGWAAMLGEIEGAAHGR